MFVYSLNRISGFSRLDIKGAHRRKAHELEITALGCTQGLGVAGVLEKSTLAEPGADHTWGFSRRAGGRGQEGFSWEENSIRKWLVITGSLNNREVSRPGRSSFCYRYFKSVRNLVWFISLLDYRLMSMRPWIISSFFIMASSAQHTVPGTLQRLINIGWATRDAYETVFSRWFFGSAGPSAGITGMCRWLCRVTEY